MQSNHRLKFKLYKLYRLNIIFQINAIIQNSLLWPILLNHFGLTIVPIVIKMNDAAADMSASTAVCITVPGVEGWLWFIAVNFQNGAGVCICMSLCLWVKSSTQIQY